LRLTPNAGKFAPIHLEGIAMGLFDSLESSLGKLVESEGATLIGPALAAAGLGSLQDVVNQLDALGMGQQVQAWIKGEPAPITADELSAIVSSDQVKQLAQHFGIDPSVVLNLLAQHLPQVVATAAQHGLVSAPN
jgi:uncharacterized protein YidB (DUF937 family)